MCCAVSKMVTSNLSGWEARVAAQDFTYLARQFIFLENLCVLGGFRTYHPSGSGTYNGDPLLFVWHGDNLSVSR